MAAVMTARVMSLRAVVTAMLIGLAACVTINVYFPAAEVERAADRLIDQVWGTEGQRPPAAPAKPTSSWHRPLERLLGTLARLLVPAAQAQANVDISSPAIETLQRSMQARHVTLEPFYDGGAIGLTEDGLITERDAKAVPLKDRQTVIGLIAAENQDRKALYREIARANGHPEWEDQVRSTFAGRWISKARAGWWYRTQGQWRQR